MEQKNNPTVPVSLIKSSHPAEKEFSPLRNPNPLTVSKLEKNEEKMKKKFIKERRLRVKNKREYLVKYGNTVHEDECLVESDKLLRRFRNERRQKA
ncbi:hypothetical protein O181_001464 [Austropuccinia psidii MF-1]|uniref:Uncharacterized protein n=1 Tax=Austropuccinia psidii MF-1 TaxID=1389203 RepID=A0A9Q3BAJ8_9BASI|nr:hypothetical protein [Austropuccinia psidii MF-1]